MSFRLQTNIFMLEIWSLCFLWIVWVSNSSTDNRGLHVRDHIHTHSHAIVSPLVPQIRLNSAASQSWIQALTCRELVSLSHCGTQWPCHWEQEDFTCQGSPWLLSPTELIITVNWVTEEQSAIAVFTHNLVVKSNEVHCIYLHFTLVFPLYSP